MPTTTSASAPSVPLTTALQSDPAVDSARVRALQISYGKSVGDANLSGLSDPVLRVVDASPIASGGLPRRISSIGVYGNPLTSPETVRDWTAASRSFVSSKAVNLWAGSKAFTDRRRLIASNVSMSIEFLT